MYVVPYIPIFFVRISKLYLISHKYQCAIQAPCEAEAQCAELVKGGKVFAVGTEDMDALTFGSTVLLRHLTFSEARQVSEV